MTRDETIYLKHILDAIEKIETYVSGFDESEFMETSLVQDAVIRQLEIVGEATKRLSAGVKAKKPEIQWQSIAGMRDKLIHDYFGVDIRTVWITDIDDLPPLKHAIHEILKTL